jgi:hypothetical protein
MVSQLRPSISAPSARRRRRARLPLPDGQNDQQNSECDLDATRPPGRLRGEHHQIRGENYDAAHHGQTEHPAGEEGPHYLRRTFDHEQDRDDHHRCPGEQQANGDWE